MIVVEDIKTLEYSQFNSYDVDSMAPFKCIHFCHQSFQLTLSSDVRSTIFDMLPEKF